MSLINDALKRASEAQGQPQAQTRPRGPKGVEDLPVPMTPVAARERPAWVPVVGIGLVIVALLGASGFFFAKWWKERKAWQPYATEDIDENGLPRTNATAKVEPPRATPTKVAAVPVKPTPAATNPPPDTKVAVTPPPPVPEPPKTNPPAAIVAVVTPAPPTPQTNNPAVNVTPPVPAKQPAPVVPSPPSVTPPGMAKVETNPPPANPPPVKPVPPAVPPDTAKKGDDQATKVASVEFPELKLQGISRRKNKTFAVLNGKTLSAGDRIEGVILLKIDTDSVIVEKGGARRELFLLR